MESTLPQTISQEISQFTSNPNFFRSLVILIITLFIAYWLSNLVAYIIIRIARATARAADNATDEVKNLQYRRLETHLSVAVAAIRALIVGVAAFFMWQLVSPTATASTAAIGASAFFIVLAGGTAGMLLRDITAGSAMIIERWFSIGDYVRIEPFIDVSGVVERITLRSTRLRSLNGEVIWLHNQQIQGVKVTPGGLRTLAVDVFVNNETEGRKLIDQVIDTIPTGPTTVAGKVKLEKVEQWADDLWLITVIGKTPPGREWLIENYFVETLREVAGRSKRKSLLVRQPLVRYADPSAEKSFRRAVRSLEKID